MQNMYICKYMVPPPMEPSFSGFKYASSTTALHTMFVFQGRGSGFGGSRVRVWGLGNGSLNPIAETLEPCESLLSGWHQTSPRGCAWPLRGCAGRPELLRFWLRGLRLRTSD